MTDDQERADMTDATEWNRAIGAAILLVIDESQILEDELEDALAITSDPERLGPLMGRADALASLREKLERLKK